MADPPVKRKAMLHNCFSETQIAIEKLIRFIAAHAAVSIIIASQEAASETGGASAVAHHWNLIGHEEHIKNMFKYVYLYNIATREG